MSTPTSYTEAKKKSAAAGQQPKSKRRYERYQAAGLDVEGNERNPKLGANTGNRGYSDSDTAAEKAERAEVARQAVVRGIHGGDLSDAEVKDEERRRQLEGNSHGTPVTHTGFSEADQQTLKDKAQFDAKAFDEDDEEEAK